LFSFGREGSKGGEFHHPSGLAFDSKGRLYVADWGNHRIQVFTANGQFLTTFGKQGKGEGNFLRPTDLDIDDKDRLYVVDSGNHRVQIFQVK
jgi:DNA-binding beta-propeller fold protein YncE